MPCHGPLTAYYSAEVNKNGRRALVFDKRLSFSGVPIQIGCGRCIGCKLQRSIDWATRCMNEKRMHRDSCFLTLTYDDKKVPEFGSLVKSDLQKFMKRLRHDAGPALRFYGCGEYGERTKRPHYHVLLFNYDFPDKRLYSRNDMDHELYNSKRLDSLWGFGHSVIGSVDFESCAYVARYCTKVLTGPMAEQYGSKAPEFSVMSRNPGIGHSYYMQYGHEIYAHDSIVVRGREVRPPRFYDERWKALDSMGLDEIKKERRKRFQLTRRREDETSRRRRDREIVQEARMRLGSPKI